MSHRTPLNKTNYPTFVHIKALKNFFSADKLLTSSDEVHHNLKTVEDVNSEQNVSVLPPFPNRQIT